MAIKLLPWEKLDAVYKQKFSNEADYLAFFRSAIIPDTETKEKYISQIKEKVSEHLKEEFQKDYMLTLKKKLLELKNKKIIFYPQGDKIFNAFNLTPLNNVRLKTSHIINLIIVFSHKLFKLYKNQMFY